MVWVLVGVNFFYNCEVWMCLKLFILRVVVELEDVLLCRVILVYSVVLKK